MVRAFVHAEIKKPLAPLLKKIKSYGWEAGIALNPDTEWETLESLFPSPGLRPPSPAGRGVGGEGIKADCVLFMTVYPGQNGAPFQPQVIPKIKNFHAAYPNIPIEVDGGVNAKTLPLLLKVGVTRLAVGSAIWSASNPLTAYKKLLKVVRPTR